MSIATKNSLIKPFVKWAGGKRQLLPEIEQYVPRDIKKYYEPFVGGGAVLFDLQPAKATINDFNGELTNAYESVKDNVDELIAELKEHQHSHSEEHYYEVRLWDRDGTLEEVSNVQRAARFIYLNRTGYNGLFRVNRKGQNNVPFGRYKNPTIVNEEGLRAVSRYLNEADVAILNGDYANAVKDAEPGDFVYLDPPYAPVSTNGQSFVGYTSTGFGIDEQVRLRDFFDELTQKGVNVMMSNSSTPLIHDLYEKYADSTIIVQAGRNINSNGNGRKKIDEVIVMNYKI
ncbi:DNA adenine methylase [Leuconostocaceae bacterium ESL0723]|nr:DNA adenine methylase [Leuconostocaceae bacterium ESL0723]